MAISQQTWDFLHMSLNLYCKRPPYRMCELGNQMIRPKELNLDMSTGKEYFESLGVDHVSIDRNGKDGSLQYDLRQPIDEPDLINTFDVITNMGTSEHVINQTGCFRNIHHLCKKNGVFIHAVPLIGHWRKHSTFHYSVEFFECLASTYGYRMLIKGVIAHPAQKLRRNQVCVAMQKMSDRQFDETRFSLKGTTNQREKVRANI